MNNYELTKTILCLDNVSAGYDGKTILKNVNLSIKDVVREGMTGTGQITAVVGRSGRGKSTLFKVLTGLINQIKEPVKRYPDHSWRTGRVLISSPIATDPDSAKEVVEGDVGFVDQKYTLFRHKTVNSIMQYAIDKKKKKKSGQGNVKISQPISQGQGQGQSQNNTMSPQMEQSLYSTPISQLPITASLGQQQGGGGDNYQQNSMDSGSMIMPANEMCGGSAFGSAFGGGF